MPVPLAPRHPAQETAVTQAIRMARMPVEQRIRRIVEGLFQCRAQGARPGYDDLLRLVQILDVKLRRQIGRKVRAKPINNPSSVIFDFMQ